MKCGSGCSIGMLEEILGLLSIGFFKNPKIERSFASLMFNMQIGTSTFSGFTHQIVTFHEHGLKGHGGDGSFHKAKGLPAPAWGHGEAKGTKDLISASRAHS